MNTVLTKIADNRKRKREQKKLSKRNLTITKYLTYLPRVNKTQFRKIYERNWNLSGIPFLHQMSFSIYILFSLFSGIFPCVDSNESVNILFCSIKSGQYTKF